MEVTIDGLEIEERPRHHGGARGLYRNSRLGLELV